MFTEVINMRKLHWLNSAESEVAAWAELSKTDPNANAGQIMLSEEKPQPRLVMLYWII